MSVWVPPQLGGFFCTDNLVAPGSSLKNTIYAFIFYGQISLVKRTKINKKRPGLTHLCVKKTVMFECSQFVWTIGDTKSQNYRLQVLHQITRSRTIDKKLQSTTRIIFLRPFVLFIFEQIITKPRRIDPGASFFAWPVRLIRTSLKLGCALSLSYLNFVRTAVICNLNEPV